MAVTGDPEKRHGIILAKNYIAKSFGIKTGEPLWSAKQKCADIVFVKPDFKKYTRYSLLTHEIYKDYTDLVESFGLDECWLDISGSSLLFKDGVKTAHEIKNRIKHELGVTASIGVSYNKIFAKLGSDYKKPDAVTAIDRKNFKNIVWPLGIEELIYVGRATLKKLRGRGCFTIGDLAAMPEETLELMLGKNGLMLWCFANGLDETPVRHFEQGAPIKSIGNSTTAPRDLVNDDDVKITMLILCESVAERLRDERLKCSTVQITLRDSGLLSFERQAPVAVTDVSSDIFKKAFELYKKYKPEKPLRSIGVRAIGLVADDFCQSSLLADVERHQHLSSLERSVDTIRRRFGHFSVQRAVMLTDPQLADLNPKAEHTIHPESFLH